MERKLRDVTKIYYSSNVPLVIAQHEFYIAEYHNGDIWEENSDISKYKTFI